MLACHDGPGLTGALSKPEHVSATGLEDQLWLGVPLQEQRITPLYRLFFKKKQWSKCSYGGLTYDRVSLGSLVLDTRGVKSSHLLRLRCCPGAVLGVQAERHQKTFDTAFLGCFLVCCSCLETFVSYCSALR